MAAPGQKYRASILNSIASTLLYILLLFANKADSSESSGDTSDPCFSHKFDYKSRWNVTIYGQEELDNFIENVMSFEVKSIDRCIQLFLTGEYYKLDIIKMMKIKLGTGGGLVVVGTATPLVKINCIARVSELKELSNLTTPLSNVSLIVLNGLMFTGCLVPVLLENVSTVLIKNCKFMYVRK